MTEQGTITSSMVEIEELSQLTETVPAMLAVFDSRTLICIYANKQYADFFGASQHGLIGRTIAQIVGAVVADEVCGYARRAITEHRTITYTRAATGVGQQTRHIEASFVPDSRIAAPRLYLLANDVTKHRSAEQALEQSISRLDKFMAASEEGVAFHINGVVTDMNEALVRMLGYSYEEVIGRRTLDFVPSSEHARVSKVIETKAEITYESMAIHKTRGAIPVEFIVRNMVWAGITQRMVIVRDISERKATLERIQFLALHDSLCGLPNRASLDEHLHALTAAKNANPFATLFLDVDQLKRINDSLGHSAGDSLLIEVADRLSRICQAASPLDHEAWLSRIGGDEFVITYATGSDEALRDFVKKVEGAFNADFTIQGKSMRASASIGIARFPRDGKDPSHLLKNADIAMYEAKNSGRRAVRYFDEILEQAAIETLNTEQDLSNAIERNQFELYFQPIFSADGSEMLSAEALLRWNHPERGFLLPQDFIHIAEESNLFLPIGQWVLDEALTHVKEWIKAGWKNARVSVNLSSNEMRTSDFVGAVLNSLSVAGISGEHLQLELTERMVMAEDDSLRGSLETLRNAGVSLAIDDFGTGFSSLSRMRAIPIDTLKIDQSFVCDLPDSHSSLAIVTALLQLGRGLSIDVVAEGVETEAQRECLELLGCTAMQGFLFAKGMSANDFQRWLAHHPHALVQKHPRAQRKQRRY